MSFMLAALAFNADISRTGRDDFAPVRKLILQAYCHDASDDGVIASRWAGKHSNDRLAGLVMRSVTAVKVAKRQLVEDGWLIQVGQARRGQGKVALYRVNVDRLRANVRAREAEIYAVEPDAKGTPVHVDEGENGPETGEKFSGRKSDHQASQDAENIEAEKFSGRKSDHQTNRADVDGPESAADGGLSTGQDVEKKQEGGVMPGADVENCADPGLVGGSSAFSGRKSDHYPISPSPPYSPPPSAEAPSGLDWRSLRDGLSKAIGVDAARMLLASASLQGRTLIFSNRFSYLDARDHHADALAALGVAVIGRDEPRSEAVALNAIAAPKRRAAP